MPMVTGPLDAAARPGPAWAAIVKRVTQAVVTNVVAHLAPSAYVRWTGQTGRGAAAEEQAADIARYFQGCVTDYAHRLGAADGRIEPFVDGQVLLEYGPGDLPGVAALMGARGAAKVWCVDRFPLVNLSTKNAQALQTLIAAEPEPGRTRLAACFGRDARGMTLSPERIQYLVRPSGLSQMRSEVDLVYSRAVLEHVDDLEASLADMLTALRPGGLGIHLVDLRSHGLHWRNPLDFLTWSPRLWAWMYSAKGVPNRWRVDRYRAILARLPVEVLVLEPTHLASLDDVAEVRGQLAEPFRQVCDDDLRCLGFWLVFRKPAV